jgi:hypothetical protein
MEHLGTVNNVDSMMNNGQQRWWNGWPQRRWFCHRDYIVTNFGPCHSVFFRNPKKCHLASGFVPKIGCLNMDVQLLTLANSPFVCSKIWYRMVPRKYSAWRTMVFPLMISWFFFGSPHRTMLQVASFWGSPKRGRMERTVPFKDPDSLRSVRNFTQRRKSRSQSLLRFGSPDLRSLRLKQSEAVGLQEDHLLKSYVAAVIA